MPELPEVEVVRRGLDRGVTGRRIAEVRVLHPRAVRRHAPGAPDFAARLAGARVQAVRRRGKYLWLVTEGGGTQVLVAHLGMSGQLLVVPAEVPEPTHLRAVFCFADGGRQLRFVDQRTFGALALDTLVADGAGAVLPASIAHLARDVLDPRFDDEAFVRAVRRRRTGIKRALLDQRLVSGIGNIYADEALWRARLHYARATETLTGPALRALLAAARAVLTEALAAGGTSFDALYVSVDGVSGLFERELAVYGRQGAPCPRCGEPIRREAFMNRSSYLCPRCTPRPRAARW